jgi:hypothetical protein
VNVLPLIVAPFMSLLNVADMLALKETFVAELVGTVDSTSGAASLLAVVNVQK